MDMRPIFSTSSWRNESICWSFGVEIKTADFYSLHKHRHCILHLFTFRVLAFWRFLRFRSEPRLKRRLTTSGGAMRELRFNSSPAASWGWYITFTYWSIIHCYWVGYLGVVELALAGLKFAALFCPILREEQKVWKVSKIIFKAQIVSSIGKIQKFSI